MDLLEIRDDLVTLRHAKNLTQADIATRSGVAQANIARIERLIEAPTWMQLSRYAEALGRELRVTIDLPVDRTAELDLNQLWEVMPEHPTPHPAVPAKLALGRVNGKPSSTLLAGAPGIGKTLTMAHMVDQLHDKAHILLADSRGSVFRNLQRMRSAAVYDVALPGDWADAGSTSAALPECPTVEDLREAITRGVQDAWVSDGKPVLLMGDDPLQTVDAPDGPRILTLDDLPPVVDGLVQTHIASEPREVRELERKPLGQTLYLDMGRPGQRSVRLLDTTLALTELRNWLVRQPTSPPAYIPLETPELPARVDQVLREAGCEEVIRIDTATAPKTEPGTTLRASVSAMAEAALAAYHVREGRFGGHESTTFPARVVVLTEAQGAHSGDQLRERILSARHHEQNIRDRHFLSEVATVLDPQVKDARTRELFQANLTIAALNEGCASRTGVTIHDPAGLLDWNLLGSLLRTSRSRNLVVVVCGPLPTESGLHMNVETLSSL